MTSLKMYEWHEKVLAMLRKDKFRTVIFDTANEEEQFQQDVILLFVLDGQLDVTVEKKVSHLKTEDLLLVNANKRHFVHSSGGSVLYMALYMDYALIMEVLRRGSVFFWCDSSMAKNARFDDLRRLVRQMLNHYVESGMSGENFRYLSDCFAILDDLATNFMINTAQDAELDESDRYEERLQQINNYIYENYDQPISMKELSEKLYLSNGYLYRFFKRNYGMSFASYLSNVRVSHAADELLYTEAPVTRIAYNNGFTSAALFNKVFKKAYGMTPSEFRKKSEVEEQSGEDEQHQENVRKRLEKILADAPKETDDSRVYAVSGQFRAGDREPTSFYWGKIINFGAAENLLHSSVREQLLILHQALGFEYVRFFGIFSKAMYIDFDREDGDYNFSQVDSILDFILEQDMKPFIELGPKENIILYEIGKIEYKDKDNERLSRISPKKWEALLRSFLQHLANRYGQDVLNDWYMDLWYDEDWRLKPDKYNEQYLTYYNLTWRMVKACNENIRFGGYSIRMDAGGQARKEFLEKWNKSECRPDFISVMYYGYERGEDGLDQYAKQTTDPNQLLRLYTREKQMIEEAGFTDVPIIINEWNITPSVRNYINDTTYKGAYIVKNTLELYGRVDAMAYSAGSDRSYSYYDSSAVLFGGPGLMTSDAIMKPAAYAFEFMNHRLYQYYLGKTDNFLVTTDGHDNYAIICHNQQKLNYNYFLTAETELDRTNMGKYYEGLNRINVQIRIDGATDGKYKIKIFRINETHGSVLHIWGNLGYEEDPSRNDLKYLRRACEPGLTIAMTETVNHTLMIEEQLMPNEIAMIRVHKIHGE